MVSFWVPPAVLVTVSPGMGVMVVWVANQRLLVLVSVFQGVMFPVVVCPTIRVAGLVRVPQLVGLVVVVVAVTSK